MKGLITKKRNLFLRCEGKVKYFLLKRQQHEFIFSKDDVSLGKPKQKKLHERGK